MATISNWPTNPSSTPHSLLYFLVPVAYFLALNKEAADTSKTLVPLPDHTASHGHQITQILDI